MSEIPSWLKIWSGLRPETKKLVDNLTMEIQKDGALSAKVKQLIYVSLYAAQRDAEGVKFHAKKASKLDATKEEIFEALQVSIEVSGLPAFIIGIEALKDSVFK